MNDGHKNPEASILAYWTEPVQVGGRSYALTVASTEVGVCWLSLGERDKEEKELRSWAGRWLPDYRMSRDRETNLPVLREIKEYLSGERQEFTISLHQVGTSFQMKVWQELVRIPYAATLSYGEVADKLGNPKGSRAVGLANGKNPIIIIVPCHRVIGKDGSLTGYGGGLDLKEELLNLERRVKLA